MKTVKAAYVLLAQLTLPCVAKLSEPFYFRSTARVELSQVDPVSGSDLVTPIICASSTATAFLAFECASTPASTSESKPTAAISHSATYDLHALAIGDWGVDLGLGSCCNFYRKTGKDNVEYYKDQQAQVNVAHLLTLSAKKLQPK